MNVYYFHPLNLTFTSAQTIQVLRDYTYLSKMGLNVFLYGFYEDQKDLIDVLKYIKGENIFLKFFKKTFLTKTLLKTSLLKDLGQKTDDPIVVFRDCGYKKINHLILYNKIKKKRNLKILIELHEGAIPHLVKNDFKLKEKFEKTVKKVDGIIFTNYSQVTLWKREFGNLPKFYEVLPNGVEIERFLNVKRNTNGNSKVLTYVGQFTRWKNVELIFATLPLLDRNIILKIAGGKDDKASKDFILNMIQKYGLKGRVDYLGFVSPDRVPEILNGSDVLLLPLGDNIQSKYLTSPMKLFEYMATGIPIVSINYPSISMIAKDCAFLATKPTPNEFAKQIKKALYDEEQIKYKTKRAKEVALKYSYENRAKKYKKFIEKIINHKGTSRIL